MCAVGFRRFIFMGTDMILVDQKAKLRWKICEVTEGGVVVGFLECCNVLPFRVLATNQCLDPALLVELLEIASVAVLI